MVDELGGFRRAGTVLRWPVGLGLASWRYMWRTSPVHRSDERGSNDDLPPPLPQAMTDDRIQTPQQGVGPLFRRRYGVRIEGSSLPAEQLMARIMQDLNKAAPVEVAVFRKVSGAAGPVALSDEYVVRMPGPWDGPVRVVAQDATSFRLATLRGHLEAGQIEFRVRPEGDAVRFEIESWATSGSRLANVLYAHIGLTKEMQLHMWTHFSARVARISGGRIRGGVDVLTRRLEQVPGRTPGWLGTGDAAS